MINCFVLAQADSPLDRLGKGGSRGDTVLGENLLVLALILFGILALLFLAVKIKYSLRRKRGRRKSRRTQAPRTAPIQQRSESQPRKRARSTSRNRSAKRNPTLSESGGLPPARPEGQAPPELKP